MTVQIKDPAKPTPFACLVCNKPITTADSTVTLGRPDGSTLVVDLCRQCTQDLIRASKALGNNPVDRRKRP